MKFFHKLSEDTYIRTKKGGTVIKAGMKVLLGWIVFALLTLSYVHYFFIREQKQSLGATDAVVLNVPDEASYRLSDNEEINTLVTNYLTAKVACDQVTLQSLVTDPSEFDDMTVLQSTANYLTGFEDTTCYIADGYQAGEYIVIELSHMNIVNVESKPIDVVTLYIVTDLDGSLKIKNGQMSEEQQAFLNEFKASQEIQDIYVHVRENTQYLLETDDSFKAFYEMINPSEASPTDA